MLCGLIDPLLLVCPRLNYEASDQSSHDNKVFVDNRSIRTNKQYQIVANRLDLFMELVYYGEARRNSKIFWMKLIKTKLKMTKTVGCNTDGT